MKTPFPTAPKGEKIAIYYHPAIKVALVLTIASEVAGNSSLKEKPACVEHFTVSEDGIQHLTAYLRRRHGETNVNFFLSARGE